MMLSLRKRFDDYETMGKVFRAFKNELLEITLVDKLWQLIEILFKEIFAKMGVDWEIFLYKLADNEKFIQIQFEFLKFSNKNAT